MAFHLARCITACQVNVERISFQSTADSPHRDREMTLPAPGTVHAPATPTATDVDNDFLVLNATALVSPGRIPPRTNMISGWLTRTTLPPVGGDTLFPGQTAAFNSGTIRFLFNFRGEQTLALRSHFLQWSGVDRWLLPLPQLDSCSLTRS